jgi:adenosylmethionine-8-amino-7-oxononanoate aminotransferase
MVRAIRQQLATEQRLGLTNVPAIELAKKLVAIAPQLNPPFTRQWFNSGWS